MRAMNRSTNPPDCAAATAASSRYIFQSARPLDYRPMAAFFVRRRIASASPSNCLLYSCRARYFPDSSWVASSTTSPSYPTSGP